MATDYKWEMQIIAEELAETLHGKDFYELDQDTQYAVYTKAMQSWSERQCDRADYLRDVEKEKGISHE